jgi:arylsulfatase A-like enzyme
MKRIVLTAAALMLILGALPRAVPAAEPEMPHNAILVGWDGAHRDHVKKLLGEGKLPNLQKLVAEGAMVDVEVTSGATDTKAGWTQILTGYSPLVTGVYNNGRYRDVPQGYSIFERLRAQYGADKIATVAVIGKKQHCGEINAPFKKPYVEPADKPEDKPAAEPVRKGARKRAEARQPGAGKARQPGELGRVVEEGGVKYQVFEGSPYYTMHNNVDQWHFGLMEDAKVGDKALEMLDQYGKKPFFFFVHFGEVDHSGHRHGEPSREYDDAIVSGDVQLGRLVEQLKKLGVYEKTLIYVTADHGFDLGAKAHHNAPYVFLATNDKQVTRAGMRVDVAPTVLDRLGIDLAKIQPALDGESLARPAAKPIVKPEDNPDIGRNKAKAGQGKGKTQAKAARAKSKKRGKAGRSKGSKVSV